MEGRKGRDASLPFYDAVEKVLQYLLQGDLGWFPRSSVKIQPPPHRKGVVCTLHMPQFYQSLPRFPQTIMKLEKYLVNAK